MIAANHIKIKMLKQKLAPARKCAKKVSLLSNGTAIAIFTKKKKKKIKQMSKMLREEEYRKECQLR